MQLLKRRINRLSADLREQREQQPTTPKRRSSRLKKNAAKTAASASPSASTKNNLSVPVLFTAAKTPFKAKGRAPLGDLVAMPSPNTRLGQLRQRRKQLCNLP